MMPMSMAAPNSGMHNAVPMLPLPQMRTTLAAPNTVHAPPPGRMENYVEDAAQKGPHSAHGPRQARFQPYQNNGGTCLAISGKDYAIVGADTRMSSGYSIISRNLTKVTQLTTKCVIATTGMQADMHTLHKMLKARLVQYRHRHGKDMSTPAIAQMLSNILYSRRFFPYYTFNVVGGVDQKGEGAVYSYDAIGSYERTPCSVSGTGQSLMEPVLDNQIKYSNQLIKPTTDISKEDCVDLVKDAFASAGERDIYTGDGVDVCVIDAEGVHWEKVNLKFD